MANYRTAAHEAIAKAFFPTRLNGYIPDADHKRRQKDATLLFKGATLLPRQFSLGNFRGPIFDQGQTGSCTGHGTAQALYTAMGAAGTPLPWMPSPLSLYKLVRTLERANASQALTDSGAMPSDLLTVCRQYGVEAMKTSKTPDGRFSDVWGPDDVNGVAGAPKSNVNDEISLLDLETSGLKLLTGEYRVEEVSPNFASQIKASLVSGAPAGIGIFVDTAFMQWDPASGPTRAINLRDQKGGGHWLDVDYFYTLSTGEDVLGGPGSWGLYNNTGGKPPESPYWEPGCYEITASCLQKVCSDCLLFPVKVLP